MNYLMGFVFGLLAMILSISLIDKIGTGIETAVGVVFIIMLVFLIGLAVVKYDEWIGK